MARTACGKNGNTADPSSHGHSSPHPVASTGLGGFALRAADRQDPVCSGVLDLEKNLKLEKEYPFSFVDLRVRDPPIGRVNCPTSDQTRM